MKVTRFLQYNNSRIELQIFAYLKRNLKFADPRKAEIIRFIRDSLFVTKTGHFGNEMAVPVRQCLTLTLFLRLT